MMMFTKILKTGLIIENRDSYKKPIKAINQLVERSTSFFIY